MNLSAEKLHSEYVKSLSYSILFTHEDLALHIHESCCCCCCNTVLACTCLSDNSCLTHLLCQKYLAKNIVDLVRTCMIEVFSFKIDLCSAQVFGHLLCIVEKRWASCILTVQLIQLSHELRIILVMLISFLQLMNLIHKSFRDVLSTELSESSYYLFFDITHIFTTFPFSKYTNSSSSLITLLSYIL